ncbi:DNA alkylation repair protein [Desertivirga xinjiangensis]|uniref:DNA alkylation repair protein n=1 Tax=Desertivirga xinjiangensis TaxID=539206 RepID=UPI00210D6F23|nr:DNA alkylation repair protein [Pedobacter xinjiangensis]
MAELLKNIYNTRFFDTLTGALEQSLAEFDKMLFMACVYDELWEDRELKQRMKHIASVLESFLQNDYEHKIRAVFNIIAALRSSGVQENSLEYMFLPEFIEMYGLDHFEVSMEAIELVTQFTSCEFDIRPYIKRYPAEVMDRMQQWSLHPSHLVRRFASEGCRPRLPWAMALPDLKTDPSPILPILENLKTDPSEFVRRSVANNLNDIAKDHPDTVIAIARKWKGSSLETDRLIKHGCRSLLKQAHADTLDLFGLSGTVKCSVQNLKINRQTIKEGDHLEFSFELLHAESSALKLRVEYAIYYMKANGKPARKLFKITENTYQGESVYRFIRRQSFKNMTTRKHYPGNHKVAVVINGNELAEHNFTLES